MSKTMINRPILIADDDPVNREILTDSIKTLLPTADVQHAVNGEQAVQLAKEQIESTNENFQLIFMDYQMPLMNGQEATKAIREFEHAIALDSGKSACIITWSASRKTPYEGADGIISKPLVDEELTSVIQG